jgi:hypothetical protein
MTKNKLPKSIADLLLAEASTIDITDFNLGMPLHVLLGESIDVARFCQHYWNAEHDPKTKAVTKPGLELAGPKLLPKPIANEILALHDLVQQSQTRYLLAIQPPTDTATVERAQFVLDELAAAIEWVCDDGVEDHKDAKLAAIVEAHRDDPDSEDALAAELADYVGLALELKNDLADVRAFDPAILDEATKLVLALRERSAVRALGRTTEAAQLLAHRNRLAALLVQRIARVRSAARFVFRNDEAIIKQVTSAYQRRRRAAARRRTSDNVQPVPPAPVPPPINGDDTILAPA